MDAPSPPKKDWTLTQSAFDKLLVILNPDRERAAEKYEIIRKRLITFFECRGCTVAEDCADVTINRVARKISEGKEIYSGDPASFFFGVAHKILLEYWQRLPKDSKPLEDVLIERQGSKSLDETNADEEERRGSDQRFECLELCLQGLDPNNRKVILRYYQGETAIKIKNRQTLAEELSITLNTLRIRALRIRKRLEGCIDDCLKRLPLV